MFFADLVWFLIVFLLGICIGSLINVCVARLPMEKSILWPGSRCFNCFQPIRRGDNLPLIGYLRLRGRCRKCGAGFSARYFWVEMFTGLGFCLIFWLDLYLNVHRFPYLQNVSSSIFYGVIPLKAWTISLFHVTFFSFLLTAALTDLDGKIIPLSITIPGTIIGIVFGTFLGWIWPNDPTQFTQQLQKLNDLGWNDLRNQGTIPQGIYPWPFWGPLPNWLPLNSPQLGFVTALVGAAVGTFMTRAVKFVFDKGLGREALGLGDADLMMLAGAFMGWQPTVISFFVGTVVTLVVAIPITILTRRRYSPFGPGLAIGFLITLYCWSWIGPRFQEYLFEPFMILFAISLFAVGAFVASLFLRMLPPPPDSLESEKG